MASASTWAFLDTPYKDATAVANALSDLGVRHVRDDLYMNNPRQYAGIKTVSDKGIKFDLIMGNPSSPDSASAYVNTVATQLAPGSVESVEGSNEWDLFGGGDPLWAVNLLSRQRELYQASKANPATANLPVLSPALAFKWNYVALGDVSPYADYANAHTYPGGYKPSNEVSQITTALRGSVANKPVVATEAGYHNALNTTNGHLPVPEDVAGVYIPRVLLEHYLKGEKRVYTYELIDEFDDPGKTNPEANFGLLRRDLSPKPAFTAMKNLLGLVSDPGPAFTPAALPVKVSGYPSDGKYVLTQKRNGQYVLLLWRDAQIYDPATKQPTPVTPTNVTLQLAKGMSMKVYRPSEGSAPVTQAQGTSLPLQMDGSVTAITIDPIPAPAPTSVTATAGNGTATVNWQLPTTDANVTGFEVTRAPGSTVSLPATARSFSDTGLTNGTSYTYSVRALSPDGNSAAVVAPAVTPRSPAPAPTSVTATAGNAAATVNWQLPTTDANVTGFEVTRAPGSTVSLPATARSFSDTGLTNGTSYTYSVRALSPDGNSAAVAAPAVTPKAPTPAATIPGVPTIVSATSASSGAVTVTWKAPASNGGQPITNYQLLSGTKTLTVSGTTLKATLTGLPKNTKLRVGVRAKNSVGWGNQAYTAYVTTKR